MSVDKFGRFKQPVNCLSKDDFNSAFTNFQKELKDIRDILDKVKQELAKTTKSPSASTDLQKELKDIRDILDKVKKELAKTTTSSFQKIHLRNQPRFQFPETDGEITSG